MNFEYLRNELRMVPHLKKSLKKLEEEKDRILYEMSGVKGIRYDKERGNFDPNASAEKKHLLSEALDEVESQIDFTTMFINRATMDLNKLPEDVREMCVWLYIEGYALKTVADIKMYTPSGIWNRIKNCVEKID